jgi:hypothetical protein
MHGTMQMVTQRSANTTKHHAIAHLERPAPRDALDLLEQFGTTVTIKHDGEIVGQGNAAEFCYKILNGCAQRATFYIQFAVCEDCLSLAPAVRSHASSISLSARQGSEMYLHGGAAGPLP